MHDRVNMNEPLVFSDDIKIFSRNAKRSIFVRDLPYCCTSADLGDFFAQALNTVVLHAMVCRNKQGRTLQIGYVLFQSEEAVRIALETMNGCRFIGRDIRYGNILFFIYIFCAEHTLQFHFQHIFTKIHQQKKKKCISFQGSCV